MLQKLLSIYLLSIELQYVETDSMDSYFRKELPQVLDSDNLISPKAVVKNTCSIPWLLTEDVSK